MGQLTDFAFRGKTLVGEVFVETGTYKGETLRVAACAGFEHCKSVEVCERHYRETCDALGGWPGVELFFGTSPGFLESAAVDPGYPTVFWLDAHYQGNGDRNEMDVLYGECPLLAELVAIWSHRWDYAPVVLIDDAYMFDESRATVVRLDAFALDQWPVLGQIRERLPPGYTVETEDGRLYCLPPGLLDAAPDAAGPAEATRRAAARAAAVLDVSASVVAGIVHHYAYACGETAAVTDLRRVYTACGVRADELRDAMRAWPPPRPPREWWPRT